MADALIKAGANVNHKDSINDSPYLVAGAQGRVEILKICLANGADLKSTNRYGGIALIPAAEKGHPEAVRLLIAAGCHLDHVNRLGWTALLEVCILTNGGPIFQDILAQLIAAGASISIPDKDGVTALDGSVSNQSDSILAGGIPNYQGNMQDAMAKAHKGLATGQAGASSISGRSGR
eukprot:gene4398-5147_t